MDNSQEPVSVQFAKFDGGRIQICSGTLVEVLSEFIRIKIEDETGEHNVRFRRTPGARAGWGVGLSKFWRIIESERKRYCHPDIPSRLRR